MRDSARRAGRRALVRPLHSCSSPGTHFLNTLSRGHRTRSVERPVSLCGREARAVQAKKGERRSGVAYSQRASPRSMIGPMFFFVPGIAGLLAHISSMSAPASSSLANPFTA